MRAKRINEDLPVGLWSDSNLKAVRGWGKGGNKDKFRVVTESPVDITTDDDVDLAKIKLLFNRYNVKYNVEKL